MSTRSSRKVPTVTAHASLRLEPELLERLEEAAARERRPLAHMMRIALQDWLADRSRGVAAERRA